MYATCIDNNHDKLDLALQTGNTTFSMLTDFDSLLVTSFVILEVINWNTHLISFL